MGYISFKKSGGEVDLLPADNIVHVGDTTATVGVAGKIIITYGIHMNGNSTLLQATVNFVELSNVERGLINSAIELANGISGPAISVNLPSLVTSVTLEGGSVGPLADIDGPL